MATKHIGGGDLRVSVVLPTYNQAGYLPEALDGVVNQTWRDYELIVVNDGSTDDTRDILDEYEHPRVRVIHQENQGLPRALNTGFRLARGELLTWTSSDNVMLPRMLEVLVAALHGHPQVGLVYADWEVIDSDGVSLGTVHTFDFDRFLLLRANYVNACFLYRRACQQAVGLYDPTYLYGEDWEYWLRMADSFEMMRVPEVLYQYRLHASSLSQAQLGADPRLDSMSYQRLAVRLRDRRWAWYFSKLKWEWLRIKLRRDPALCLRPDGVG